MFLVQNKSTLYRLQNFKLFKGITIFCYSMNFSFLVVIYMSIYFLEVAASSGDCGASPMLVDTDDSCLMMKTVPRYDTTVGSKIQYHCASLLTSLPTAQMNYCPVQTCTKNSTWSKVSLSCAQSECYHPNASVKYSGKRTCTTSGLPCQNWISQSPYQHRFNSPSNFPDDSMTEAGRYCRDPGGVHGQPWCYTMDKDVEWEFCGIPSCKDMTVNEGRCMEENTRSVECNFPDLYIATDSACTELAEVPVTSITVGSTMKYACKSFLKTLTSKAGYCPVERCQANGEWTEGTLTCAGNECYKRGHSVEYNGYRNCTASGKPCQFWADVEQNMGSGFPFSGDPGNYCRDPGGVMSEPYCFLDDKGKNWETCGIQFCEDYPEIKTNCILDDLSSSQPSTSSQSGSDERIPLSHSKTGYKTEDLDGNTDALADSSLLQNSRFEVGTNTAPSTSSSSFKDDVAFASGSTVPGLQPPLSTVTISDTLSVFWTSLIASPILSPSYRTIATTDQASARTSYLNAQTYSSQMSDSIIDLTKHQMVEDTSNVHTIYGRTAHTTDRETVSSTNVKSTELSSSAGTFKQHIRNFTSSATYLKDGQSINMTIIQIQKQRSFSPTYATESDIQETEERFISLTDVLEHTEPTKVQIMSSYMLHEKDLGTRYHDTYSPTTDMGYQFTQSPSSVTDIQYHSALPNNGSSTAQQTVKGSKMFTFQRNGGDMRKDRGSDKRLAFRYLECARMCSQSDLCDFYEVDTKIGVCHIHADNGDREGNYCLDGNVCFGRV